MKILSTDGFSSTGIRLLEESGHEVLEHKIASEHLANFINENSIDVLIVRSRTKVTKELLSKCENLKIVGRGGVGLDNIDTEFAKEKGITVLNTPFASSRSVAEMVFAHFFTLSRQLQEANRLMPLEGETRFNELKKSLSNGKELEGKTLGVIGFGAIGQEVVKIGIALGMKPKVLTRTPKSVSLSLSFYDGQKVSFQVESTNDMKAFLSDVDFLSINTPKTQEYIIDAPEFDCMKEGVFIVNTARGGVLNEVALIDAIEDKVVCGAALDVFEKEPHPELAILMNPALSLSPHLGGSTKDAQDKIALELAQKIIEHIN